MSIEIPQLFQLAMANPELNEAQRRLITQATASFLKKKQEAERELQQHVEKLGLKENPDAKGVLAAARADSKLKKEFSPSNLEKVKKAEKVVSVENALGLVWKTRACEDMEERAALLREGNLNFFSIFDLKKMVGHFYNHKKEKLEPSRRRAVSGALSKMIVASNLFWKIKEDISKLAKGVVAKCGCGKKDCKKCAALIERRKLLAALGEERQKRWTHLASLKETAIEALKVLGAFKESNRAASKILNNSKAKLSVLLKIKGYYLQTLDEENKILLREDMARSQKKKRNFLAGQYRNGFLLIAPSEKTSFSTSDDPVCEDPIQESFDVDVPRARKPKRINDDWQVLKAFEKIVKKEREALAEKNVREPNVTQQAARFLALTRSERREKFPLIKEPRLREAVLLREAPKSAIAFWREQYAAEKWRKISKKQFPELYRSTARIEKENTFELLNKFKENESKLVELERELEAKRLEKLEERKEENGLFGMKQLFNREEYLARVSSRVIPKRGRKVATLLDFVQIAREDSKLNETKIAKRKRLASNIKKMVPAIEPEEAKWEKLTPEYKRETPTEIQVPVVKKVRERKINPVHRHKCDKCNMIYEHKHLNKGEHAQSAFQCANINCEWFFKKGNERQKMNNTRTKLVSVFKKDVIWHSAVKETVKLKLETGWQDVGSHIRYSNFEEYCYPWHVQKVGRATNDIKCSALFKARLIFSGEFLTLGSKSGPQVQVEQKRRLFTFTDGVQRRAFVVPTFKFNGNLKSGTPIFDKSGNFVSIVTASYDREEYVLLTPHEEGKLYCGLGRLTKQTVMNIQQKRRKFVTWPNTTLEEELLVKLLEEDKLNFFYLEEGETKNYTGILPYHGEFIYHSDLDDKFEDVGSYVRMKCEYGFCRPIHCTHQSNSNTDIDVSFGLIKPWLANPMAVYVGKLGTNMEHVAPYKFSFKYVVADQKYEQKAFGFLSQKNYKSGTPIYNSKGELISIITVSLGGRVYMISNADNEINAQCEVVSERHHVYGGFGSLLLSNEQPNCLGITFYNDGLIKISMHCQDEHYTVEEEFGGMPLITSKSYELPECGSIMTSMPFVSLIKKNKSILLGGLCWDSKEEVIEDYFVDGVFIAIKPEGGVQINVVRHKHNVCNMHLNFIDKFLMITGESRYHGQSSSKSQLEFNLPESIRISNDVVFREVQTSFGKCMQGFLGSEIVVSPEHCLDHVLEINEYQPDVFSKGRFHALTDKIFINGKKVMVDDSTLITYSKLNNQMNDHGFTVIVGKAKSFVSEEELLSGTPIYNEQGHLCDIITTSFGNHYALSNSVEDAIAFNAHLFVVNGRIQLQKKEAFSQQVVLHIDQKNNSVIAYSHNCAILDACLAGTKMLFINSTLVSKFNSRDTDLESLNITTANKSWIVRKTSEDRYSYVGYANDGGSLVSTVNTKYLNMTQFNRPFYAAFESNEYCREVYIGTGEGNKVELKGKYLKQFPEAPGSLEKDPETGKTQWHIDEVFLYPLSSNNDHYIEGTPVFNSRGNFCGLVVVHENANYLWMANEVINHQVNEYIVWERTAENKFSLGTKSSNKGIDFIEETCEDAICIVGKRNGAIVLAADHSVPQLGEASTKYPDVYGIEELAYVTSIIHVGSPNGPEAHLMDGSLICTSKVQDLDFWDKDRQINVASCAYFRYHKRLISGTPLYNLDGQLCSIITSRIGDYYSIAHTAENYTNFKFRELWKNGKRIKNLNDERSPGDYFLSQWRLHDGYLFRQQHCVAENCTEVTRTVFKSGLIATEFLNYKALAVGALLMLAGNATATDVIFSGLKNNVDVWPMIMNATRAQLNIRVQGQDVLFDESDLDKMISWNKMSLTRTNNMDFTNLAELDRALKTLGDNKSSIEKDIKAFNTFQKATESTRVKEDFSVLATLALVKEKVLEDNKEKMLQKKKEMLLDIDELKSLEQQEADIEEQLISVVRTANIPAGLEVIERLDNTEEKPSNQESDIADWATIKQEVQHKKKKVSRRARILRIASGGEQVKKEEMDELSTEIAKEAPKLSNFVCTEKFTAIGNCWISSTGKICNENNEAYIDHITSEEKAVCICDNLKGYIAGHLKIITDGCQRNYNDICRFVGKRCSKNNTVIIANKKHEIPEYKIGSGFFIKLILSILLSVFGAFKKGMITGLLILCLCYIPFIDAANCTSDHHLISANTETDVYRISGTWRVGDCIRFGENTLSVKYIQKNQIYIFSGDLITDFDYQLLTAYGCPWGESGAVCNKDLKCKHSQFQQNSCTNGFNGAFAGTSCALEGTLHIKTAVCYNVTAAAKLFSKKEEHFEAGFSYEDEFGNSKIVKISDENEEQGTVEFDHIRFPQHYTPSSIVMYNNVYIVEEPLVLSGACMLNTDKQGKKSVGKCSEVKIKQVGSYVSIEKEFSEWLENLGNSRMPQMGEGFQFSEENGILTVALDHVNADVKVPKKIIDETQRYCVSIKVEGNSIKQGVEGNYAKSEVVVQTSSRNCYVKVECGKCQILPSLKNRVDKNGQVTFGILCGITKAVSCNLTATANSAELKITGLSSNMHLSVNQMFKKIGRTMTLTPGSDLFKNIREFSSKTLSAFERIFNFSLSYVMKALLMAVAIWLALQFFLTGNYVLAVIIVVSALVPVVLGEPVHAVAARNESFAFITALLIFALITQQYWVLVGNYMVRDDIMALAAQLICLADAGLQGFLNLLRSDYNTIRARGQVILDLCAIIVMQLNWKYGMLLLASNRIMKIVYMIYAGVFKTYPTENDSCSLLVHYIARMWPKKSNELEFDNIEFHSDEVRLVKMSFIVRQMMQKEGDAINYEFESPYSKRRAFYVSKFAPGIVCAPAHAVFNDINANTLNDVVYWTTDGQTLTEISEIILSKNCVSYKLLPEEFKKGDSGRIFFTDGGFYMHSGVMRNKAPVCCFCGLEYENHMESKQQESGLKVCRKGKIELVQGKVSKLSLDSVEDRRVREKDSKFGKLVVSRFGATSKIKGIELVKLTKEQKEIDRKETIERLERNTKKAKQQFWPESLKVFFETEPLTIIENEPLSSSLYRLGQTNKTKFNSILKKCKEYAQSKKIDIRATNAKEAVTFVSKITTLMKEEEIGVLAMKMENLKLGTNHLATEIKTVEGETCVVFVGERVKIPKKEIVTNKVANKKKFEFHCDLEEDPFEEGVPEDTCLDLVDRFKDYDGFMDMFGMSLLDIAHSYNDEKFENVHYSKFRSKYPNTEYLMRLHILELMTDNIYIYNVGLRVEFEWLKKVPKLEGSHVRQIRNELKKISNARPMKQIFDVLDEIALSLEEKIEPLAEEGKESDFEFESEIPNDIQNAQNNLIETNEQALQSTASEAVNVLQNLIEDASCTLGQRILFNSPTNLGIKVEINSSHWLMYDKYTYIYQIDGLVNGHASSQSGSTFTCFHAGGKGNLVIPYYSNDSGTMLKHETLSTPACYIEMAPTTIHTIGEGDLNIYDPAKRNIKFRRPTAGQIYIVIDLRRNRFSTLLAEGQVNTGGENGLTYDTFSLVDITKPFADGENRIIAQTGMKGVSGSPIIGLDGLIYGVYGTSCILRGEEVERTLVRHDAFKHLDAEAYNVSVKEVYERFLECKKANVWLRVSASTGTGKSSSMMVQLAKFLRNNKKDLNLLKKIRIMVLVPTQIVANRLYEYVSNLTANSAELKDVLEIQLRHGGTDVLKSTATVADSKDLILQYTTYGSAIFRQDELMQATIVVLDEIHTRRSSDVLAVEGMARARNLTNVMAMTATTFVDSKYHDYKIEGETRWPILQRPLGKYAEDKHQSDSFWIPGSGPKREVKFRIPKDKISSKHRTLIFYSTQNECERAKKELNEQGAVATVMYAGKIEENAEGGIICATDVVESGVTIPNCNLVIDFKMCNKVCGSIVYDSSYYYSREMKIGGIDSTQQQQRMGRTGRTCAGEYWHDPDQEVEPFDQYPSVSVTEAAISIIASANMPYWPKNDYEAYIRDNPVIYWFSILHPENVNFYASHGKEKTVSKFLEQMTKRAKLARNYKGISPASIYLMPTINELICEVFEVTRNQRGEEEIEDTWEELGNKVSNETLEEQWKTVHGYIIDSEITRYLDSDDLIEIRKLDAMEKQARIAAKFGIINKEGDAKFKTNSETNFLKFGLGMSLASIVAGTYIYRQLYEENYGKRQVTKILKICHSNQSKGENLQFLKNFEYNDSTYHTTELKKSMSFTANVFKALRKGIQRVVRQIAILLDDKRLLKDMDAKGSLNLNADVEWFVLIQDWWEHAMQAVKTFDWNQLPEGGVLAIFPAIGLLFNKCAEKYGEVMTTVAASAFAIFALQKFGSNIAIVGAGVSLLVNLARNSMFLGHHQVDYSPNLAFAIGAVPLGFKAIQQLLGNSSNVKVTSEVLNKIVVAKEAEAVSYLGSGSGGADSGFSLIVMIEDLCVNGFGENTSDKITNTLNVLVRMWNIKSLNMTGLVTAGVTAATFFTIEAILKCLWDENDHSCDNIKFNDIAKGIYLKNEEKKKERIELVRTIMATVKVVIGASFNPMTIPFIVGKLVTDFFECRKLQMPFTYKRAVQKAKVAVYTCPFISAITLAVATYKIMTGITETPFSEVEVPILGSFRLNSEESYFKMFTDLVLNAYNHVKESIGTYITGFYKFIVSAVFYIRRVFGNAYSQLSKMANLVRNQVVSMFIGKTLGDLLKVNVEPDEPIRFNPFSTEKETTALLYKYGLGCLHEHYLIETQNSQIVVNWYFSNIGIFKPSWIRHQRLLNEIKVQSGGIALATELGMINVTPETKLQEINERQTLILIEKIQANTFWHSIDNNDMLGEQPLDLQSLEKKNITYFVTRGGSELIIFYRNMATTLYYLIFIGASSSTVSGVTYVISNDWEVKGKSIDFLEGNTLAQTTMRELRQRLKKKESTKLSGLELTPLEEQWENLVGYMCFTTPAECLEKGVKQIFDLLTRRTILNTLFKRGASADEIILGYLRILKTERVEFPETYSFVNLRSDQFDFLNRSETTEKLPNLSQTMCVQSLHSIKGCHKLNGLQVLVMRCLKVFENISVTISMLNFVTGKTVYYTSTDRTTNLCCSYYTTCHQCYCIITPEGFFDNTQGCAGQDLPLVKLTEQVAYASLTTYGLKKILDRDPDVVWEMSNEETCVEIDLNRFYEEKIVPRSANFVNLNGKIMITEPHSGNYLSLETNAGKMFLPMETFMEPYNLEGFCIRHVSVNIRDEVSAMEIRSICMCSALEKFEQYAVVEGEEIMYINRLAGLILSEIPIVQLGFTLIRSTVGSKMDRINQAALKKKVINPKILENSVELIHTVARVPTIADVRGKHKVVINRVRKPLIEIPERIKADRMYLGVFLPDINVTFVDENLQADAFCGKCVRVLIDDADKVAMLRSSKRLKITREQEKLLKDMTSFISKGRSIEPMPVQKLEVIKVQDHRTASSNSSTAFKAEAIALNKKNLTMMSNKIKKLFNIEKKLDSKENSSSSESLETITTEATIETTEPVKLNLNTNKSMLGAFFDSLTGQTNFIDFRVANRLKSSDQNFIHQVITKEVAEAIISENPDTQHPIQGKESIVHFDAISRRRLINHYDTQIRNNIFSERPKTNDIPQGPVIIPFSRQDKIPDSPKVDSSQIYKMMQDLEGMVNGPVWDCMKRYNRVFLPKNDALDTVSRGFFKIHSLEEDLLLVKSSRRILDLSAGKGGFAHFVATYQIDKQKREYVWTTLTRPGHVNMEVDSVLQQSFATNKNNVTFRQCNVDNGDFRLASVYSAVRDNTNAGLYDLLICDCGESSPNLFKESDWLTTRHPIYNKAETIDQRPAYAVAKYISLLKDGGNLIIKMMGFETGTLKALQMFAPNFSKILAYKMPTSSYQSREWYFIGLGKKGQCQEWPNLENWLIAIKSTWATKFFEYYNWVKSNKKAFYKDLKQNGATFLGMGFKTKKVTMADILKSVNVHEHVHTCEKCGRLYAHQHNFYMPEHAQQAFQCPNTECSWYWKKGKLSNTTKARLLPLNLIQEQRQRPIVPVYSVHWRSPTGTWTKVSPLEIEQKLKEQEIRSPQNLIPCPETWECLGEVFTPDVDRRYQLLKKEIEKQGWKVLPPTGKFEKIHEIARVNFKESYGQEKHTYNYIIGDLMYNVFGLNPETSVIGHTQCTREFISAAHKKRLDLKPSEPCLTDQQLLYAASLANCTPEYNRIKNGEDSKKFAPLTVKEAIQHLNMKGAGGKLDKFRTFKDAVADEAFLAECEEGWNELFQGKTILNYQTCRDKRETKAKKNINSEGELVFDGGIGLYDKEYKACNAIDKRERRKARLAILKESSRIMPRNIRYTQLKMRLLDVCLLHPYQSYHNNVKKMYFGSITGTPLWKQGDVLKAISEVYGPESDQGFLKGEQFVEKHRKLFSDAYLNEFDQRNVKVQLFSDVHSENVLKRIRSIAKSSIVSGDFSGWDGTLNNTDHCIEMMHLKGVYQEKYHPWLKARATMYMFNFTLTDTGNLLFGWGQRGSGDQATSSGNTFHNGNLHIAAVATSFGISCEEAIRPIGKVLYRAGFEKENAHYKEYFLSFISHVADGDDNNHFGLASDLKNMCETGINFIQRCGKKIRSGTRDGYDVSPKFEDLSFCSHHYERTRIQVTNSLKYGNGLVNNLSITKGERPKRIGDVFDLKDEAQKKAFELVNKEFPQFDQWNQVHQFVYDALNDLKVTFLPTRVIPEIFGKLTYTIKNEVMNIRFNRDYLLTVGGTKQGIKNERAIEITRGKALAYLLNYIHIESVRKVVCAIMATIGDGTCDIEHLRKRGYNVPSTTSSLQSAMKSVHNVDFLDQVETLPRRFDREGLRVIRRNAQQFWGDVNQPREDSSKVKRCPIDIEELIKQLKVWLFEFAEAEQFTPDPFWVGQLESKPERIKNLVVKPQKSKLFSWFLTCLSIASVIKLEENWLAALPTDLSGISELEKITQIPNLGNKIKKKLVFTPLKGTTFVENFNNKRIKILFLDESLRTKTSVNEIKTSIKAETMEGHVKVAGCGYFKNMKKVIAQLQGATFHK
nr:putative polyprotein [Drosophila-associated flavivirus 7]